MEDKKYILAVPNFSDGRNQDVIDAITGEIKNREGVKLVSVEPVTGSELVGPVKLDYLLNNLNHYLGLQGLRKDQILETHLMR